MKKRILTGITTTGIPHIGNYVGAIRPALSMVEDADESFFFLAAGSFRVKGTEAGKVRFSSGFFC